MNIIVISSSHLEGLYSLYHKCFDWRRAVIGAVKLVASQTFFLCVPGALRDCGGFTAKRAHRASRDGGDNLLLLHYLKLAIRKLSLTILRLLINHVLLRGSDIRLLQHLRLAILKLSLTIMSLWIDHVLLRGSDIKLRRLLLVLHRLLRLVLHLDSSVLLLSKSRSMCLFLIGSTVGTKTLRNLKATFYALS